MLKEVLEVDGIESYILPELAILIPVLYGLGMILKSSEMVKDKMIPMILGLTGILLASLYEVSAIGLSSDAIFAGITQGIICTCASVYVNQLYRQTKKAE